MSTNRTATVKIKFVTDASGVSTPVKQQSATASRTALPAPPQPATIPPQYQRVQPIPTRLGPVPAPGPQSTAYPDPPAVAARRRGAYRPPEPPPAPEPRSPYERVQNAFRNPTKIAGGHVEGLRLDIGQLRPEQLKSLQGEFKIPAGRNEAESARKMADYAKALVKLRGHDDQTGQAARVTSALDQESRDRLLRVGRSEGNAKEFKRQQAENEYFNRFAGETAAAHQTQSDPRLTASKLRNLPAHELMRMDLESRVPLPITKQSPKVEETPREMFERRREAYGRIAANEKNRDADFSGLGNGLSIAVKGLGAFAGAMAMAYHGTLALGQKMGEIAQKANTPFLTGVQQSYSTPIVGDLRRASDDIHSGYSATMQALRNALSSTKSKGEEAALIEGQMTQMAEHPIRMRQESMRRSISTEQHLRNRAAENVRDFQLPNIENQNTQNELQIAQSVLGPARFARQYPGSKSLPYELTTKEIDRGSVAGAVRVEEERALLPLRQNLERLALSSQKASGSVKVLADRETYLKSQMDNALALSDTFRKQSAEHSERAQTGDTLYQPRERILAASKMVLASQQLERYDRLNEERIANANKLQAAEDTRVKANNDLREGFKDLQGGRLGVLEKREQTAADQARNLGLMGVDGRIMAQHAFQAVQQLGISNSPGELIAAARAFAPQTIDKQAEQAGIQFADVARQSAPGEYRDRLPDIRESVDEIRKQVTQIEGENIKQLGKEFADVIGSLEKKIVGYLKDELTKLGRKLEAEANQGPFGGK